MNLIPLKSSHVGREDDMATQARLISNKASQLHIDPFTSTREH